MIKDLYNTVYIVGKEKKKKMSRATNHVPG